MFPARNGFCDACAPNARPFGITPAPLTYDPPISSPDDLKVERQAKADAPDLSRCWEQTSPARQLPNLQRVPILVLTAEASYHANYDHCTVKYLRQAGVQPTWIKLADAGIHGNGHMMMLEKNNQEIARLMAQWLQKDVSAPGASV